jgi:ATP-grasp domain/L-amino acid ligase C-terminal domain 2
MKRVLLFATTTGYQTRMFGEAAERLSAKLLFATDRCDQLEDPWWDGAIPVRFHEESPGVDAVLAAAADAPIDGLLAVGDRPAVAAAVAAERLGLTSHSPRAARAARDKRLMRDRLRAAGLPVPTFHVISRNANARDVAWNSTWPVVVKPAVLSGSRGVLRADNQAELVAAVERVQRLLEAPDVRALRDSAADQILIESFIPGREYALEGVVDHGVLRTLAIFDKPDPLDGPLFEETIYVTPSRASDRVQERIHDAIATAAAVLGLYHGPVHAECRVNDTGVHVLEIAARPIGGLCARALSFVRSGGESAPLEELLLRHALSERLDGWRREPAASGVMMIPIPAAGIYRGVEGTDDARAVAHIYDLQITAKPDQLLVPLPEGSSYLGFLFAKANRPDEVERALRQAHARLAFTIDRALPMVAQ